MSNRLLLSFDLLFRMNSEHCSCFRHRSDLESRFFFFFFLPIFLSLTATKGNFFFFFSFPTPIIKWQFPFLTFSIHPHPSIDRSLLKGNEEKPSSPLNDKENPDTANVDKDKDAVPKDDDAVKKGDDAKKDEPKPNDKNAKDNKAKAQEEAETPRKENNAKAIEEVPALLNPPAPKPLDANKRGTEEAYIPVALAKSKLTE
jgi:hypothetical protein